MTYEILLDHIYTFGEHRGDRTGTGTISMFAPPSLRYDMSDGFPLITTKKMFTRGIIEELLWFLRGDTNVRHLQEKGVHIWDGNYEAHRKALEEGAELKHEDGDLGPIYGHQWRHWDCCKVYKPHGDGSLGPVYGSYIDQISSLVDMIKNDPTSRRLIVSAWNVADIDKMALPPCHVLFQCYVRMGEYLDMHMYQRSADMFLGVPFNIASYAFLLHILCDQTGYKPGRLVMSFGDAHIYQDHVEQVREQCLRAPYPFPTLKLNHRDRIEDYEVTDFVIENYQCHPAIKAPMSV